MSGPPVENHSLRITDEMAPWPAEGKRILRCVCGEAILVNWEATDDEVALAAEAHRIDVRIAQGWAATWGLVEDGTIRRKRWWSR